MGNKRIEQIKKNGDDASGTTRGGSEIGEKTKDDKRISAKELTPKEQLETGGNYYARDCEVSWFNDQWLYDLVWPYLLEANKESGWNWDIEWAEGFQFTKYTKDGLYNWHNDGGSDHYGKYLKDNKDLPNPCTDDPTFEGRVRKISMTMNLTDPKEYDGGKLKFDLSKTHDSGIDIMEIEEINRKGSIVFFPSFMSHTITPITRGTRYSLVLWVLGQPWR
jgi:PKHD-type hydroxylase